MDIGYQLFSRSSMKGCSIMLKQSISVRIVSAAIPGVACGNTIRQKIRHSDAPYSRAASMESSGMLRMN